MPISRYLNDDNLSRMARDFKFLNKLLKGYKGELDIALRDNYFNIYYRGNSLAKVDFRPGGTYGIRIHKRFFDDTEADNGRFGPKPDGSYAYLTIDSNLLHPLLQRKHLDQFCSRVKNINYQEELVFEQELIADNRGREDLIFIDRQITDAKRNRLDLLALVRHTGNQYRFLAVEVKLGNNTELKEDVARQLEGYVKHMAQDEIFADYKACYEKHYRQKKQLELLPADFPGSIDIVPGVEGLIVVGGYSRQAKEQVVQLKSKHPDIKVALLSHRLNINKIFNCPVL